jgi:membrane protein DedA with SNARE-associated domain
MAAVLPILLFALAGVLAGGVWSTYRQGASRGLTGLLAVLTVLAAAGGVLWLIPQDS